VVAYAEPNDLASLRVAGRAGLRREGIARSLRSVTGAETMGTTVSGPRRDGRAERGDHVQLARLASDPEPTSGEGFIGILNAGLPTKRGTRGPRTH